ncbi:MAG: phospholipase D-like domain-containing protein [Pseudomonas sp.]
MKYKECCVLVLLLAIISACGQLPVRPELGSVEAAIAPGSTSQLDRVIALAEQRHQGESAFRLVPDGYEAFAVRSRSALVAERSIDVQTYIWHADATGAYLAHALLVAADKGVKVRILVDDMDAREKSYEFSALSAHPNIAVRFFNPFSSRTGTFFKFAEALSRFGTMNKRMHNKSWIVDNRVAFAGGRNIGDEYFGASDSVNFVDMDVAMIGPVVRDLSASFDRYWNASVSYPAQLLSATDVNAEALAKLRETLNRLILAEGSSRYASTLRGDPVVERIVLGDWSMHWTDEYRWLSDDPLKAIGLGAEKRTSDVYASLLPAVQSAHEDVWIFSPYFVPGPGGVKVLQDLCRRGVDVRLITNSLASNDVVAVHSGYRNYRKQLLESGVKLWELKPVSGKRPRASLFGSSGASLHSKALVFDGSHVFVGSYNLDPRSNALNTEQGVLFRDDWVGERLRNIFMAQSDGAHAWRVQLQDGDIHWSDGKVEHTSEPGAGLGRRVLSRVISWLPLERHL